MKTKSPERHGTCRLVLLVNGTEYTILPVRDERGRVVSHKLRKADGTTHIIDAYGNCSCDDFRFVQRRMGGKCKHLKALEAVGLR